MSRCPLDVPSSVVPVSPVAVVVPVARAPAGLTGDVDAHVDIVVT